MLNAFAAAVRLTTYQTMGARRKWRTVAVLMLPVALALGAAIFGHGSPVRQYTRIVSVLFANVIVPFLALFWGTSLINDEIEGKTLVYLVTRPTNRAQFFAMKFVPLCFWLLVLIAPTLLVICSLLFWREGFASVFSNLQMAVWDMRSLFFGGVAYAAIGFCLASLLKKPLLAGIVYVFVVDSFAALLPGFLKHFSIRYYLYLLGSNPHENQPQGFFKFLASEEPISDLQALATLIGATLVLVALGSYFVSRREYSGDDPARAN
jgi:ABC-type transport system involved in multi-copper enzyme maturation permease subunit